MKNKKKKYIVILVLVLLIVLIIGLSYAWLMTTLQGEKDVSILVDTIDLELDESASEGIQLVNAIPTYDDDGKEFSPYKFSLTNKSRIDLYFSLSLIDDEELINSCQTTDGSACELLDTKDIRYEVKVGDSSYTGTLSDSPVIYHGVIDASETLDCELRVWLNINAGNDVMGKAFLGKLQVFATQQVAEDKFIQDNEEVSEPKMDSNMIAVRHDGYNWVKTDKTSGWYNYGRGIWANAVTVSSSTREKYLNAGVGTVINMDDIETMWVWIPRYSYTITSEDGTNYYGKRGVYLSETPTQALPGEIDIKFIGKDVKEKGTARYSNTESPKNWYTPDAFTFGDEELSGIWVGKFETSSSNPGASNGGGNVTNLDPMIKPNVPSWRGINVSNIYNVGLKVSAAGNRYGFNTRMNSHAMRNDEWGAVAYLSQSAYGKLGNVNFIGADKEIYQNKSNSFITGCSSGAPSSSGSYGCPYTYDNNIRDESGASGKGVGASTTGTIYGVYDMSGGAWEYVMGNYNDTIGGSGFSDPLTLDSKYYNKYTSSTLDEACDGSACLSHGLSETAGWYGDYQTMITASNPWSLRGGHCYDNSSAGVFSFSRSYTAGGAYGDGSFRLVMSPSL